MHAVGELDIKLIEGKNLKKTDLIGKTDPFVVMYVRQTKDKMKRSTKKKNTLNPVWNENFKVEVKHRIASRLYVLPRYFDSGVVSVEIWEAINVE
jgi:Ca2+-dependent lipid-binding protein